MTAKPASQKVYIYRGDPWEMVLSSSVDGVPEPVVAADALAEIRTTTEDPAVIATLTVVVTGVDDEIVTLSLDPEETAELPPGEYVWDFQPNEESETWVKGPVVIEGDVSKPVTP